MGELDFSIRNNSETDKAKVEICCYNSIEPGSQRFPDAHRPNWCKFIHNLGEDLFKMMED